VEQLRKALLVLVAFAWTIPLLFAGCNGGGPPDPPPHSSWQERGEYCYSIVVDPRGNENSMIGYSDDVTLIIADAGFVVQASDVRVDPDTYNGKDYYSPFVTWATDGDGYADIQGCAPTSIEVR